MKMKGRNRPDVLECAKPAKRFEIEAMSYADAVKISWDFRNAFLFKNNGFDERFTDGIDKKLLDGLFEVLQISDLTKKRTKL